MARTSNASFLYPVVCVLLLTHTVACTNHEARIMSRADEPIRRRVARSADAAPDDYDTGCGTTKSCFRDSSNGNLVTYSLTPDGQQMYFEMQTEIGSDFDWIAIAFGIGPIMVNISMLLFH